MKYLSDYTEEKTSKLFKELGAFFAFSDKQFEEAKDPKVEKYVSMGGGMIVPEENAKKLIKGVSEIHRNGIKQDLEENGKEGVIARELANHEAYYTHSVDDTLRALEGYNITEKELWEVFRKESSKYDQD